MKTPSFCHLQIILHVKLKNTHTHARTHTKYKTAIYCSCMWHSRRGVRNASSTTLATWS